MLDKAEAAATKPSGPSMLAGLMTVAAAYSVRRGISLDRVADAAGLAPHAVIATSDRVPDAALPGILRLLQDEFPGEPVALDMAATAPLHAFGPLESAARLVPDLRAGLEMFVDFQSVLSTRANLEFVDEAPGPLLRLDHPNDHEFGTLGAEMALVMAVRVVVEVFGVPGALSTVWFGQRPAAHEGRYADVVGVPVRFDAPCNAVLFNAKRLDDPVDPDAGSRLRVLRAQLELVRQQLQHDEDPAELRHIRDAAARNAAQGDYSAGGLARRLGVSPRTLQRRVGDLGTTVRDVIDEVRAATALQLMSDPDLNLSEISLALGYSTESAFRRAFRRWTGTSPSHYRRS